MAHARRSGCLPALIALVLLGAARTPLVAQETTGLRVSAVTGEVGGSFDASWLNQDAYPDQQARHWREWVQVMVGGSVVHPNIMQFRLVGRPLLAQGVFLPRVDSVSASGNGDSFVGSARLDLFPRSQIRTALMANRDHFFQRTRFGGWSESAQTAWGVEVRDVSPLLPAELTIRQEDRTRGWLTGLGGRRFSFDNHIGTIRYDARNRKTRLLLERVSFRQNDSDLYVRRGALFRHNLRWGSGSSLISHVRYTDRVDGFAFRNFSWTETTVLRQGSRVVTELRGGLARTSSPSGRSSQVEGGSNTTFRAAPGLELSLSSLARRWRIGSLERVFVRGGPTSNWSQSLPAGARLVTQLEATYEHHAQSSGDASFADAIQEAHIAGASGFFRLNQPFVDPSSLVVSAADGSQLYQEGFDYRVVSDGPYLEVHVLPGSRIPEDEQLAVDYRFQISPEVSARALTLGFDVRLYAGRLTLAARRRKQEDLDDVPPNVLPVLRNQDRSALSASLDLPVRFGSVLLFVEERRDRSDRYDFAASQARGTVTVRLGSRSYTTVTGRVQRLRGGSRPYTTRSLEQALVNQLTRNVRVRTSVSHWDWRENGTEQSFWGVGGGLDWVRFRTTVTVGYDFAHWVNGSARGEHRLLVNLKRRF